MELASIPPWFAFSLLTFTVCSMVATAILVQRRFGKSGDAFRKAWLKYGSIAGIGVLTIDAGIVFAYCRP